MTEKSRPKARSKKPAKTHQSPKPLEGGVVPKPSAAEQPVPSAANPSAQPECPLTPAAADPSTAVPESPPAEPSAEAQGSEPSTPEALCPKTPHTAEVPVPKAPPPAPLKSQAPWYTQYEAVVGLSHRDMEPPMPCQDAALARQEVRHPWLLVADGAGSSAVSELGAQAVVTGLNRFLLSLESRLFSLLDNPEAPSPEEGRAWSLLLVKHARGLLEDLAAQQRRPLRDFRCTLLLAVVGQQHTLWLKVGDGMLITQQLRPNEAAALGWERYCSSLGGLGKGEFANQTTFIDEQLQPEDVQSGLLASELLCGVALMSDGAAERLVSADGQQVSGQLQQWLDALSCQTLRRRQLTQRFYAEDFTSRRVADDCSIALAARALLGSP